MSVPQAAELRTQLRDADTTLRVVKNTLTERAAGEAGTPGLTPLLQGPTALAFVRGDAAQAAKALTDFRRASGGLLVFKGGWMNGDVLTAEQIDDIARLPSREVLYGRLVGMVASPLTGLASALNGLISGLARQLSQIAEQGLVPAAGTSAATAAAGNGAGDAAPSPSADQADEVEADAAAAAAQDPDGDAPDVPEPSQSPDPDPTPDSQN